MSKKRTLTTDSNDNKDHALCDDQSSNTTCPSTKLERRRRIEELHDAKKLREELDAF